MNLDINPRVIITKNFSDLITSQNKSMSTKNNISKRLGNLKQKYVLSTK